MTGEVIINSEVVKYKLDRTHGGEGDHPIEISVDDETICGELIWKRYKTNDEWTSFEMIRKNKKLDALLPQQPPAGKLVYHVVLQKGNEAVTLPEKGSTI